MGYVIVIRKVELSEDSHIIWGHCVFCDETFHIHISNNHGVLCHRYKFYNLATNFRSCARWSTNLGSMLKFWLLEWIYRNNLLCQTNHLLMGIWCSLRQIFAHFFNLYVKLGLFSSNKIAASAPRVENLLNNEAKYDLSSLLYIHSYLRYLLPLAHVHTVLNRSW